MIRAATPDDAEGIAAIYNDAVANTTAIWNEITVDAANRVDWMAARMAGGFPVLVAEADGQVAGYASYGPWRAFDGYRLTVEHSVYVAAGFRGRGLARALMQALIARARAADLHVMVAAIEAENRPSITLHESLGFANTHTMRHVGQKFGRWLDLTFMELHLDDRPTPM
ncbi:GNAT family N-acetyltransferase [Fuscibacter oryzae]|uniref:N-acetyltransferase n=1 Tax=Fuscibacter oryzae TaxID=2803939 RepID=A0A8J7ST10_9RHOB|nr:GNAT family N-acetyltransferase [Fuscibacter oryzae]MBL4927137.1 N-acetyltransferase [Fuscibacter oryzae]